MSDEVFFQSAIESDYNDTGARLLLGDWLAERGDRRATGYRWMGRHHKRPLYNELVWKWWTIGMGGTPSAIDSKLQPNLTGWKQQSTPSCFHYSSREDAEKALCRAVVSQ